MISQVMLSFRRVQLLICALCTIHNLPPPQFSTHAFHSSTSFGTILKQRASRHCYQTKKKGFNFTTLLLHSVINGNDDESWKSQESSSLLSEIDNMKTREIMRELKNIGIQCDDVFEKRELVLRLYDARKMNLNKESIDTSSTFTERTNNTSEVKNKNAKVVPLYFYSLEQNEALEGRSYNGQDVYIRPSPGKFVAIKVQLPSTMMNKGASNISKDGNAKNALPHYLTMLIDTACTNTIIRSSTVQKYNIPTINTSGVKMTAAGGDSSSTSSNNMSSILQIGSFILEDGSSVSDPTPAIIQDLGPLPKQLDGIIGLSVLNQFKSLIFDISDGTLVLNNANNNYNEQNLNILSSTNMSITKLGIYTAPMILDGRGPIQMIVDTGAASTIMNWFGVQSLNMSRNHPRVVQNNSSIGAIGADSKAMELSHRFVLTNRFHFVSSSSSDSISAYDPSGIDITQLGSVNIDIGDVPILTSMKNEGVGGILGSDILMRCDVIKIGMTNKMRPSISLFQKTQ